MRLESKKTQARAAWFEASEWDAIARLSGDELVALLEGDQLRQALRDEVVEEVLRRGYPWALHLDAADLRRVRHRSKPGRRMWFIGVAVLFVWALGMAWRSRAADAVTNDGATVTPSSTVALETARRVDELRAQGRDSQARALAEGCVVASESPGPCLEALAQLVPERAPRYRQLALEADHDVLRQGVLDLLTNDFARDASFLAPAAHDEQAQAGVVHFIDRALELEEAGRHAELLREAHDCSLLVGQLGLICRDFSARAAKFSTVASPLTEDTPRLRAIHSLRMAIDSSLLGRPLAAVDAATACIATGEVEAVDCRRIAARANAQWWAELQRGFDEQERRQRENVVINQEGF